MKRQSKRAPFDPTKHQVLAPRNPLVAAWASLDDARWAQLERWARETSLDGANWPDWKRLFKALEGRVWPVQTRGRWEQTEGDIPADAPLASEREAWLLGIMIGRLDSALGPHSATRTAPDGSLLARLKAVFRLTSSHGPSGETVAYLVRRAGKLLRFLRDGRELKPERRALLVPLVAGSLARLDCQNVAQTLAFRLNIAGEILADRADWVGRIWNDADLAVPVLKWAFEWLRAHDEPVEGTTHHVRRFAGVGEAEVVLTLLPALLQNGVAWPKNYGLKQLSGDLQSASFTEKRGEVLRLFARFPSLPASDGWILRALDAPEANELEVVLWVTPLLEARARAGQFALVSSLASGPLKVFLDALVAARPGGLSLDEWKSIGYENLIEPLAPALTAMPMSREIADFLWFNPYLQGQFIRAGGEAVWVEALAPMIRDNAQKDDFSFALLLPPLGRALFFRSLSSKISASTWQKMAELDESALELFAPDIARLPLSEAFWAFASEDEQMGARWLELVGRQRAETEFLQLSPSAVQAVLESNAGALTPLIEAWLQAHANTLSNDEPLLLGAATHLNESFRMPAFARLRLSPMNLRVALRLMESGLPEAMSLARPFLETENDEWAARVLALADSPKASTRAFALDLLARFPTRWTSDLLSQLAEHDDPRVGAFVAARLDQAPRSEAVASFQNAILNGRGRARRAKIAVQRAEKAPSIPVLLDAARVGSPHDRAWALQQLVKAKLNGVEVPALEISGALSSD